MHQWSDLRSDTVTRPGPAMRQAMAEAEVGDAVYGEDPTINRLEARVAELLGKEAALYVPTGTMANTLAIRLCGEAGDEVLCEAHCHPVYYEAGGSGAFSGTIFKTIAGQAGVVTAEAFEAMLYEPVYYRPIQRAILIENTHNRGGGTVYPMADVAAIGHLARSRGLRLHMDGARLWNACAASGYAPADYAAHVDTVSVCFSKALGAPVGSALAGSRDDIERARHYRHMLGGSWRQAGILAAAALYALDHHVAGLAEDHAQAQALAMGLRERQFEVVNRVETNMVYFALPDMEANLARLYQQRIRMSPVAPGVVRCVTHRDVDAEDIQRTLQALGELA
jgi:threonine aldolase